jgi:hypothetical protein
MLNFLRLIGLLNAAIWLGGCVFFTLAAAPAIFQPEMKRLFQDYYTGIIAQFMQQRYFNFQVVCGAIAIAQALLEWVVVRRPRPLLGPVLLAILYALTLSGAFWFQPRLVALHRTKYTASSPAQREQAATTFRAWHGLSQGINLLAVVGLAVYVGRMRGGLTNL